MFDHDNRTIAADIADEPGRSQNFLMGHAGSRLVKQHEFRIARQDDAELQPLSLAVGKPTNDLVCQSG